MEFVRRPRPPRNEGNGKRKPNELRPVFMSLGTVAKAAGSAYIEVGGSKLLCSVYGPRPDPKADYVSETGRLSCNVKVAPFAGVEVPAELEKELPLLVKPALEPAVVLSRFPKSVVEIHILVLEQEGDVVSAAITCASLAMADAEIEMFDLVAASSVAVHSRKSSTEMQVDPSSQDVAAQSGSMLAAMMPSRGEVTQLSHVGEWEPAQFEAAMELGVAACKQVHGLMRRGLIEAAEASVQKQPPA